MPVNFQVGSDFRAWCGLYVGKIGHGLRVKANRLPAAPALRGFLAASLAATDASPAALLFAFVLFAQDVLVRMRRKQCCAVGDG